MRYIAHDAAGGPPDTLRVETGSLPSPRPGEVLVRVMAAGVNRPDVMQRAGAYPPPQGASPVLGLEIAGIVVAVVPSADGAGLDPVQVGDRVCALVNGGGYAEYCVAPALQCLPWPEGYDAVRAAALPETYFTVWSNLFRTGHLAAGETVLVHGGTSGIGSTAIQFARSFGARVFATAGSAAKCALCLELGAEAAINYRDEDFAERIATLTGKRGVDVVLDLMGAPYLSRNLASLADLGRLVLVAVQGGAKADTLDLARIMSGRLTLTGTTMRPRTAAFKAEIAEALRQNVWPLLDAGTVRPLIHKVLPFTEAAQAHTLMESGSHAGKIILSLSDPASKDHSMDVNV
ncbi:NAD(P)H-quinone oxidoreductase [Lichenicola cladoniae]|uniref:NAD(P)H-quinone oxidoreductase n=1 Tax=Lichenicola cladoniae TaxID=1484109 RepID=A0A6M8HWB4_9PROT|nr:NAD(P)H-quinone oxidoreductase [Lichenicola cladoniae]NPD68427.1 NAD(P)H-quinone oxidoreductase [Acetobacteraceae bacterium]QKE92526.1 NAD(P)H-quinone oxidoreductase [Lichenicola cladoniae]